MDRSTWPSVDLALEQDGDFIHVTQGGTEYLVRGQTLSEELLSIVDAAVTRGISCAVRTIGRGHPTRDKWLGGEKYHVGSHSLPFSRSPEERWVFAIDEAFPRAGEVVFEKAWRHFIHRTGVPWKWEVAGGKNVLVQANHFFTVLDQIDDQAISEVEHGRRERVPSAERIATSGLSTEAQLQALLAEQHADILSADIRRVRVEMRNDAGRADIVLETKKGMACVLELKRGLIGETALQQVTGYMASPEVKAIAHPHAPTGAIIAAEFNPALRRAVDSARVPVGLYRYEISDVLFLTHVAGREVLDGSLILA